MQIERRQIHSPINGKITLMMKHRVGERVVKGEELVHISRGEANRAMLLVGESQMYRIRPDQPVRMKSNSFDVMRYGYIEGHVREVALEPSPAKQDPASNVIRQGTYRVMVKIDRTPVPLVLGSSLDAWIILRQMRLWQVLFPVQSP